MKKFQSWAMFVEEKNTGKVYGWVGRENANNSYPPDDIKSVLDENIVMGIKQYIKADQSFGVFSALCRKYNPGEFTPFMVRLSKNNHAEGLKCKYIGTGPEFFTSGSKALVKYEFSYES